MDFILKPADIEQRNDKIKKAKHQKMLIVEKMHHDRMLEIFQRFGMQPNRYRRVPCANAPL